MEEKCHSERDSKQHLNSVLPFYASLSSSFNELSHQQQPNHHHNHNHNHNHNHHHHHLLDQEASEEHLLLNQPTSSRSNNSMSVIQEDFINIPHNYSEVLDDETTTSGVLDTFEISSSNSLPACSDTVDPIAVDDSSSTDTIKLSRNSVQNKNATHFFNDDDEVYVIDDDDLPPTTEQKSQLNLASSHLVAASLNGVIKVPSGTNIFLETPVVEEQQQQQLVNIVGQLEYYEKTGHPKRLSDEFGLAEDSNVIEIDTNDEDEDDDEDDVKNQIEQKKLLSSGSCYLPVGLSDLSCSDGLNESQHDKMSSRLKKMTLGGRLSVVENLDSRLHQDSNFQDACTSDAAQLPDIESMDFIERRDFETEQKLTGGITIKNRTLIDQDMLNLNLIKSCIQPPNPSDYSDDIPCSSTSNTHARTVSSDSKCNYKDPATTPTSSRTFSQAKSKSTTAKLNYRHLNYGEEIQDFSKPSTSSNIPFVVEDDAPTTSSFTSRIKGQNLFKVSGIKSDIFCNSNSNESLSVNGNDNDNDESRRNSTESQREKRSEQWHNELIDNQGCSRTTALIQQQHSNGYEPTLSSSSNIAMPTVYDEDAQPSTSSARCQYVRQVQHASAQTVERYLPRSSGSSASSSSLNTNSNEISSRGRRRTDSSASSSNRKNNSEEGSGSGSSTSGGSGASSATTFKQNSIQKPIPALRDHVMFNENSWIDCDETSFAEQEEICTCDHNSFCDETGSNTSLNDNEDFDFTLSKSTSQFASLDDSNNLTADGGVHNISTSHGNAQRKRKYNDSRLIDTDSIALKTNNGCNNELNSRKRVAYDCASSPRSSQLLTASTPSSQLHTTFSPMGKRTPRSLIPSRDNPPPELQSWIQQFQRWSNAERLLAVDRLIENCNPTQVRHMMKIIEPQFQRDFISLLPRELALSVLSYLEPKDLLRAAQTCRSWRFLCDDNLLWKEKCRKAQILTEPKTDLPKRGRAGTMPPISSPWKAAYMRQHIIEMNWRSRPIREKKILKGHDDHVITCLQFSGNRIVSGSDDNTLKVWSAVTGRCLLTLSGHTGGVWSSQMSGKTIISGSTDRTLKVWDMETGVCIHTLQGHTSTVRCMHLHGKKVVSGSRDATLRVWDIERGTCLHLLVGHLAAVRCVQYDGKLIVSGAYDYMVKVWHPERQECLHTLQGHTNRVYSLQFDGVHVVSGSLDTSIKVWEVETGNCKHTLMGHQSLTSGMELRQNILVSGNADSTVKVWDITTGQCLQTLSGPNKHQSAVTCLQFNSRFVITSSDDGTVKLWDVKTGEFIRNLVTLPSGGSGGVVWRIRASDTKLICAVGSRNGTEETKLMVLDFDVEGACLKCS